MVLSIAGAASAGTFVHAFFLLFRRELASPDFK